MKTGIPGKPAKAYHIRWSEKIYRLHQGGVMNHGPRGAAVFEIVLFPPGAQDGEVIYAAQAPAPAADTLQAILEGRGGAPAEALKGIAEGIKDAYFDFAISAELQEEADLADLAWALVRQKQPRLNPLEGTAHSGRWSDIEIIEG
jgi:hypothetical protein